MMEHVIEMNNVSRSFQEKQAVKQVSFTISRGSITAVLGPNGAGKTTTLAMLLGLLEPSEGSVKVFGHKPTDVRVKQRTGAMLQEVSVMDRLKVREILALIRSYYPQPMEMEVLLQATGLGAADLNRYAEKLSGGQKRSLSFALALAGNPDLLFLMSRRWGWIRRRGGISGIGCGDCLIRARRFCSAPITCRKRRISRTGFCCSTGECWRRTEARTRLRRDW